MDLREYSRYGQEIRRNINGDSTIRDFALANYILNLCGLIEALAVDAQGEIETLREQLDQVHAAQPAGEREGGEST